MIFRTSVEEAWFKHSVREDTEQLQIDWLQEIKETLLLAGTLNPEQIQVLEERVRSLKEKKEEAFRRLLVEAGP